MSPRALERPTAEGIPFGIPADDPLAARLFPPLPGAVRWGLDRTERILASLNDPHRAYPVLHVGGTNGKGSVARIWERVLRANGLRTGLYTSPHLLSFRERILVEGLPLEDAQLEEWARNLRPLLVRESPSFFEAATALALLTFARADVDVAVVEVGLGGRLDATNVVRPALTAVTNVAWEHADLLGGSLSAIAREKAGILKPGVPAFTGCEDPSTLAVLTEEAASLGVPLRRVPPPEGRTSLDGSRLRLRTRKWGELDLATSLVGRHQLHNLALAVHALAALPPRLRVSAGAIREGVLRARVPGRFQVERDGARTWILDAAHNPHGIEALVRALRDVSPPRPLVGLVGILSDKPWTTMVGDLMPELDSLVLTVPESAPIGRRWDPRGAALSFQCGRVRAVPDPTEAFEVAREASGASGTIVVAGSSYTVGDMLRRLGQIPREALPPSFASG